ncbi:SDR family oxidoreductase [Streptomyces sp. NPDC005151]
MSPAMILLPFHAKVVGPIMLAKHFAPTMPKTGSFVVFSEVTALQPNPSFPTAAATNSSVDAVTRSLAVELAPLRLNAISPGTIDTTRGTGRTRRRAPSWPSRRQPSPP